MAERSGASAAVEAVILGLILFSGMAVLNPGAGVLVFGFAGLASLLMFRHREQIDVGG